MLLARGVICEAILYNSSPSARRNVMASMRDDYFDGIDLYRNQRPMYTHGMYIESFCFDGADRRTINRE